MNEFDFDVVAESARVHELNKKWWRDLKTGTPIQRNKGEQGMLIVSELSEAMEGARKDLMDDHLPHRTMEEVEIADTLIRCLDYRYGHFGPHPFKHQPMVPVEGDGNVGERLMMITSNVVYMTLAAYGIKAHTEELFWLDAAINTLFWYAQWRNLDLLGAFAEKNEYNKTRADHQPAARLEEGGKKW